MRIIEKITKAIPFFYYLLFAITPLLFFHKTSELFEFNKIVFIYFLTALIFGFWIAKMVASRKVIFKHSSLDIPIILFLISQVLATIISIDTRTSIFGYYSRFNGGLISSFCYAILYWAYVSNMVKKNSIKLIKILFVSAFVSGVWAIFEHFGHSFSCLILPDFRTFDVSCWVQDVATRVFSSFGQPNWLAAFIVAVIPLTWAFGLNTKTKEGKVTSQILRLFILSGLSALFFLTLLFTKSRSGILAFIVSALTFWTISGIFLGRTKQKISHFAKVFLIFNISFLILTATFGTPWTPTLNKILQKLPETTEVTTENMQNQGPVLDYGGTESGKIREIVWKGAINIWRDNPLLGTGVETFAYSYYAYRPAEHNLTSEWDYLYNKAHNEYLNYAATTGTVGLLAYFLLIGAIIYIFGREILSYRMENKKSDLNFYIYLALIAGFLSILITNFFGFSTVMISVLFLLFPAMAITLTENPKQKEVGLNKSVVNAAQAIIIIIILLLTSYFLFLILRYWYTDFLYNKGKNQNSSGNYIPARDTLTKAIELSPNEAIYWEEKSESSSKIAAAFAQDGNQDLAKQFTSLAIDEINTFLKLSPANINLKRSASVHFIDLSLVDPKYIYSARDMLEKAVFQAPTDAHLLYNLGLANIRTGDNEIALEILKKTIELKPDYKNAYNALALVYKEQGKIQEAIEQYEFILTNIDPNDATAIRELTELDQ